MRLSFGAWEPDLPTLAGGGGKAFNVLPAAKSFRPVADLAAYSANGIGGRCQGFGTFADKSGNASAFAADATRLWRLDSTASWTDVSGVAYSTPTDTLVSFAQYGNQIASANFVDPIQLFTLGVSTAFVNLSADAPKAKSLVVAENFLIAGNTNDPIDGAVPYRVWWSKQGDITAWPTPGSQAALAALSDKRDLAGSGGAILSLAAGVSGCSVLIYQERAVVRGLFLPGSDQIFQFDIIEGASGVACAGGVVVANGTAFSINRNGFYASNGETLTGIGGQKVDKFFFSDPVHGVDATNLFRICAVADPINKIVMWAYPSVSGGDGNLDRIICYNYETGGWSLITGLGNLDLLAQTYSLGLTLEGLDALGNVDTLVFSLDSRQLTGGNLLLGGILANDRKLYTFTGSTLAATLTLAEQSDPSGQRLVVNGVKPLVEGTAVTVTFTPRTRNKLDDPVTVGSTVARNATGICPLRVNAFYLGGQVDIAAGSVWTHALGADVPDTMIARAGYR